ncbi:MAG: hydroxymethylglutaryl-CoA lyase, partial [Candidatus Dormibacteraeota bacterium]|nr:hydroxymethylglutaryl-CoA lyase [Candidatus Dormibacteraeota bacterium]
MGEALRFVEVGPRDGFQNWPDPVSTEIKEGLVRDLLGAGVETVEATSFVSPKWVPQMADAEDLMRRLGPELHPRLRVLVPNLRGYERAVAAGARSVVVNVGATEGFNRKNLNRGVEETVSEIVAVCAAAAGAGVEVAGSLSVAWGCPYDGPVGQERAMAVARRLLEAGCDRLSIADTIGVANPESVATLCRAAVAEFGSERVAVHFHDTRGLGVANVLTALESGVREFEGSIGGIGGCPFAPRSTGNVCSEDLLHMLELIGFAVGARVQRLLEIAASLAETLGKPLPGKLHRAGLEPWVVAEGAGRAQAPPSTAG